MTGGDNLVAACDDGLRLLAAFCGCHALLVTCESQFVSLQMQDGGSGVPAVTTIVVAHCMHRMYLHRPQQHQTTGP
jgi:hypothetical protein